MKKRRYQAMLLLLLFSGVAVSAMPQKKAAAEPERIWAVRPYEGELQRKEEPKEEEAENGTQEESAEEQENVSKEEPLKKRENVSEGEPVALNRWNITLTNDEKELLARIVWLEACGEPIEGQQAVVEVIFNRMSSEDYPDSLYGVLSQTNPQQFCSFPNREKAMPTEKEYQSIEQVLNGESNCLSQNCIYFSTFPLTEKIECKIGGHYFCD